MNNIYSERSFEDEICLRLAGNGWLYEEDSLGAYSREQSIFSTDMVAWVTETQPGAWSILQKNYGDEAAKLLMQRLRAAINASGTLEVLKNGFEVMGLRRPISMAQFRPSLAMNSDLERRYTTNRLRVVRQVRYSVYNENCIDLVFFLNGIPVATVELKSDYTQAAADAEYQYKKDRPPKVAGKNATEPLLSFSSGALVHFAASNSEVRMTTKLAGMDTVFLPFNRGNAGGAGNTPNMDGYATAYFWDEVLERHSWLEILGRYVVSKRNEKKQVVDTIFPRYHQLDATRKLISAIKSEGLGHKYLIQHSAGSGKTNSIAWTAHFLADLHDDTDRKVFHSVIVISDRTVLDTQLQEAIMAFERTQGVVAIVTGDGKSKGEELAEALSDGKKIVVCTIQTFPFALKKVRELAATQGKRFAVIADEAHSSQTNDTAAKLKLVLSAEEQASLADGGEVSVEDILATQMEAKANTDRLHGLTFVAFTATPKDKTLQLFGTLPDPTRVAGPDNIPRPFHVYSMRQAIEEGFILDVLQNYVSYKVAYQINDKQRKNEKVGKKTALKAVHSWARLHPHNISQKVQVVVEHFLQNVRPLLNGTAKAMVVTASRVEAIRWQLQTQRYIKEQGYDINTLVAFSGEVIDPDSAQDALSETSSILNNGLNGRGIHEAFKQGDYALLLVANKFQTGFDEPLLCGMYVDKKLDGVQAVQTLSRLNRCYKGKDMVYVVDFVNDPEDILAAFKKYHTTAELSGVTDPHLVYDLRSKLDSQCLYDDSEVDRVVEAVLAGKRQSDIDAGLTSVADRILSRFKRAQSVLKVIDADSKQAAEARGEIEALHLFKSDIQAYVRTYGFLSQIFDYGNTDIEKRAIFFRLLARLLNFGREIDGVDLSSLAMTHYTIQNLGQRNLGLSATKQGETLDPLGSVGSGRPLDEEKEQLAAILEYVNSMYIGDIKPEHKLNFIKSGVMAPMLESETLIDQATNNTKEQFASSPDIDQIMINAIIDAGSSTDAMRNQSLASKEVRAALAGFLIEHLGLYEALRARTAGKISGRAV